MPAANFADLSGLVNPQVGVDEQALQRNMAIAQMLRQQAMSPLDTANRQVGGVGYRISPFEAFAKALQGYSASKYDTQNDAARLALNQRISQSLLGTQPSQPDDSLVNPVGGPPMGGPPASPISPPRAVSPQELTGAIPSQANNPQTVPQQSPPQQNPFALANLIQSRMVEALGGENAAKAFWAGKTPTEAAKRASELGIPLSVQAAQYMQEMNAKGLINVRPGGTVVAAGANGQVSPQFTAPANGQNITWQGGQPSASPVPGAAGVTFQQTGAAAAGKAAMEPFAGFGGSGQPAPITSAFRAATGQAAPGIPGVTAPQQIPPEVMAAAKSGKDFVATQAPGGPVQFQQGGGLYGAPPLGAVTGANNSQDDLSKKWMPLNDQAGQAQTTKSYLQSIKDLAAQAQQGVASGIGPFAAKGQYINAILSLGGVSQKAVDATTATNLLDKYANQITARLGQGGLGTDAARAILQSAYPNSNMNLGAINEAADNLAGSADMINAKANLLSPHYLSRDAQTYGMKERAFDQAADPRIWQLQNMSPDKQATYVQSLPPAVAKQLLENRQKLKALGVIQ